MATPAEMKQDTEDFSAAFAQDVPAKKDMTDDEAFGLVPDAAETAETAEPDEATEPAAQEAAEPAEPAEADPASVAVVIAPEVDPKDVAREKSWEGRLKAREVELKAREEALKAREEAAGGKNSTDKESGEDETPAHEAGETGQVEALEGAAEAVESGEMTVDEAMKTLASDFGDELPRILSILIDAKATEIAGKTADERMGTVNQKIDSIVSEIVDDKARGHFEAIADAHPDFMDVAKSPEFKSYLDAMAPDEKMAAQKVVDSGSARQIIRLLNAFKASKNVDEPSQAMDAAEGVRSSGGLKIPAKPAASQSYQEAWNSF